MTNMALIPARSGSKGLKDKNIINLKGKPLMVYTIEAALDSGCFGDLVYVSTDSKEYADIAREAGARVIMRGEKESNDLATSYAVVEHAFKSLDSIEEIETFALLQPTSPLRHAGHIQEAYQAFREEDDFCVSMTESPKSSDLIQSIEDGTLKNYDQNYKSYRRQKHQEYYPNGAIFIGRPAAYLDRGDFFGPKSRAYIMEPEDSIDIDGPNDLLEAISILSQRYSRQEQFQRSRGRIQEKLAQFTGQGDCLFYGHSVLDFYPKNEIAGMAIDNLGVSGACAKDLAEELLPNVSFKSSYDFTLMMLGVNDIKQGYSLEEFTGYLEKNISGLKEKLPKSRMILSTIMHNNGNLFADNTTIDLYNQAIEKLAEKYQTLLLDFKPFENQYGKVDYRYSKDGVHLTEAGYDLLEKEIMEMMSRGA